MVGHLLDQDCLYVSLSLSVSLSATISLIVLARLANGLYAFRFSFHVLCMCASAEVLMVCGDLFLEGLNGFELSGHYIQTATILALPPLMYTHTHTRAHTECVCCRTKRGCYRVCGTHIVT